MHRPRALLCLTLLSSLLLAGFVGASAPRVLRFEIRNTTYSARWADRITDTLVVTAREGEPLLECVRAPTVASGFTLRRILAPDRAWIGFDRQVAPHLNWGAALASGDSVTVSTAWRTFMTPFNSRPGLVGIRILPDRLPERLAGDNVAEVLVRERRPRGFGPVEEVVQQSSAIGLFRLESVVTSRESSLVGSRQLPIVDLTFHALEIWKGSKIRVGDQVVSRQLFGQLTDTSWVGMTGVTPMRDRHLICLFLQRAMIHGRLCWTFSPWNGYGLFDDSESVSFSIVGRGVPISSLRRIVLGTVWAESHRDGQLGGVVVDAEHGRPVRGVRVSIQNDEQGAVTDSSGEFELLGLTPGVRRLRVAGECSAASRLVEVSDEFTDEIEVRVPFSAPPCRLVRVPAGLMGPEPLEPPVPPPPAPAMPNPGYVPRSQ